MIKTNILIDNNIWFNRIKNKNNYFKKKLIKLSKVMPKLKKKYEISILLSSSKEIKELNKKFRKKNKVSDVLSFPFWDELNPKIFKNNNIYLGDIAICFEVINGRAKNKNFKLEFDKAWVHGFLHLLGYDHNNEKNYKKINNLEKKIINFI